MRSRPLVRLIFKHPRAVHGNRIVPQPSRLEDIRCKDSLRMLGQVRLQSTFDHELRLMKPWLDYAGPETAHACLRNRTVGSVPYPY